MQNTINPRDLRVGDAEREHVCGVLQKAVSRGLLDLDEFTTRVDVALAAVTRGELNAVLVDLPGVQAAPERLELVASLGSLTRKGPWTVPGELVVRCNWASADLDFTAARIPYQQVRLVVDSTGGSVELRLPAAAGVVVQDVHRSVGAEVNDKRRVQLMHGRPQFVVTGSLRCSYLTIRGPR